MGIEIIQHNVKLAAGKGCNDLVHEAEFDAPAPRRGNDALISPIYANEFASQIVNWQVEITRNVDTCRKRNSAVVELLESRFLRPKGASL